MIGPEVGRRRLAEAARRHLPAALAEEFLALLQDALALLPTDDPRRGPVAPGAATQDEVVGWLGGEPLLPADVPWPVWPDRGPLAHAATLDCGALAAQLTPQLRDAGFPTAGLLSFFVFDKVQIESYELIGSYHGNADAARVLHVADSEQAVSTRAPEPLTAYPRTEVVATAVLTWPGLDDDAINDLRRHDEQDGMAELWGVVEELQETDPGSYAQVGGHADSIQLAVRSEVAYAILGRQDPPLADDEVEERVRGVADRLMLLAQFESVPDLGLNWGGYGSLYYVIDGADLAAGNLRATESSIQGD